MGDHETEHDWIVPNLLRRTGWHVVIGDDAAEVAAALFHKALAAGAHVLLAEPRWTGLFWDLHWEPQCALRTEHCVITVANDLWYQPDRWLAEADVAMEVREGLILTLRGGMANARPVEVASLVPPAPQPVVKSYAAAKPPRRDKVKRPYPIRGWRGRMWQAWDRWQREQWERGERDGSRP